MDSPETLRKLSAFISKMRKENVSAMVIDTFSIYYRRLVTGKMGMISDREITPVKPNELTDAAGLGNYASAGRRAFKHAVMIRLNGGLGTGMGLAGPKSLLEVKEKKSFLDIIVGQAEKSRMCLSFMNSFITHKETVMALAAIKPFRSPLLFIQHKYPKIMKIDLSPAVWPRNPNLEWSPPGHGDVYAALYASGVLDKLLSTGIQYAFFANSDNLGAVPDPALLGYFKENRFPFMMEVAEKTPSDIKGGHLARLHDGRLLLREFAQCPVGELAAFTDINKYRFFNTNNIWVNLVFLKDLFEKYGALYLPMIVNPKTIDPRDEQSPGVYQIETAMGSAISLFEGATAVITPRCRFFPVKKCNDLLAIRSDCYLFSKDGNIIANPERTLGPVKIDLDSRYYKKIDDFNPRFLQGAPSLVDCESLTIYGNVFFEGNVKIVGRVTIRNHEESSVTIKTGSVLDQDVTY